MQFQWSRLLEAGAVVLIMALTLTQVPAPRTLLNFFREQGWSGPDQRSPLNTNLLSTTHLRDRQTPLNLCSANAAAT
jgi:hypothetical protein